VRRVRRGPWERIVRRARIGRETKCVALLIATYADNDGTGARPGESQLAEDCEMDPRTVRRHLAKLRELELALRVGEGYKAGRRGRADEYVLTAPDDLFGLGIPGGAVENPGQSCPEIAPEPRTRLSGDQTGTPDSPPWNSGQPTMELRTPVSAHSRQDSQTGQGDARERAPDPPTEFPDHCDKHRHVAESGPCGGCADRRRARAAATTDGERKPARPPWCGQCDEITRQLDTEPVTRCPRCHPARAA
jgi:DNA-binding transcriptional ArsR family regulator